MRFFALVKCHLSPQFSAIFPVTDLFVQQVSFCIFKQTCGKYRLFPVFAEKNRILFSKMHKYSIHMHICHSPHTKDTATPKIRTRSPFSAGKTMGLQPGLSA